MFKAASQGDRTQLNGLLEYLQVNDKRLTSPDFTGKWNGSYFVDLTGDNNVEKVQSKERKE